MAIVQYTGIVNQLRGKLNGSVFNKSKTAFTLQRKQQQSRGIKGNQSNVRQYFQQAQRAWKQISSANQAAWQTAASNNPSTNRFGEQVALAGYNQFVKANIYRIQSQLEVLASPDASPATQPAGTFIENGGVSYSQTAGGAVAFLVDVNYFTDAPANDYILLVDISLPISSGITAYHGRFAYIGSTVNPASGNQHYERTMGTRYPYPSPLQFGYLRMRLIYALNGAVVYTNINRISFQTDLVLFGLSISPTSGNAPYTLSVESSSGYPLPPDYEARFFQTPFQADSCPVAPWSGTISQSVTDALTETGTAMLSVSVPSDRCRGYRVQLYYRGVAIGNSLYTYVDNI